MSLTLNIEIECDANGCNEKTQLQLDEWYKISFWDICEQLPSPWLLTHGLFEKQGPTFACCLKCLNKILGVERVDDNISSEESDNVDFEEEANNLEKEVDKLITIKRYKLCLDNGDYRIIEGLTKQDALYRAGIVAGLPDSIRSFEEIGDDD